MYLRSLAESRTAPRPATRALTLVEMLIGMAITLVMMAAVVTLFANLGAGIRVQKAAMDISGQLRMARARLYQDLAGATCDGIPKSTPGDDDKADGYIEIVEGQWSDKNPSLLTDGIDNATNPELNYATSLVPSSQNTADARGLGDYDDILALTVRSDSEPFVGRGRVVRPGGDPAIAADWIDATIESDLAEVVWYAVENPADGSLGEPGMRTVYRRVFLIVPWIGPINLASANPIFSDQTNPNEFFRRYDISARYDLSSANAWIPNSLSDLTKRENRFAHFVDASFNRGYPHIMGQIAIRATSLAMSPPDADGPLRPLGATFENINLNEPDRQGEDVMLNDVLAFDVRVLDPRAPLFEHTATGTIVEPSDFGWSNVPNGTGPVGYGAYVDLLWNNASPWTNLPTLKTWPQAPNDPPVLFGGIPHPKSELDFSPIASPIRSVAYDTWSFHYENDGIDQDDGGTGPVDEGMNSLDDNVGSGAINGTDDVGERETSPPYNVPLRGIQVKLRVYDPDSRQIREATVTKGFN